MPKVRLAVTILGVAALGFGLRFTDLSAEALADSENWSRFRGPNGTGVSSATNLPVEFGPESHVKWKTPLPPGHSSPVFTNTHIFLTAHSPEKDAYKLFVLALDRKTGKQLWQHEVPRQQKGRRENVNGPASPSPVTDGTQRLLLLPGLRADQLHRRRQGALAHAARSVQHVLRLRRLADS